jgi:shikimate dehydrogenase
MSDIRIPLAGVIGHPVAHSKSPRLHGYWLRTLGLAGAYVPLDVRPQDLHEVLKTLPRMGFVGANVTIPHKEAALALADKVSDRAALIGAANTLAFHEDGTCYADNTDGYGFIENIRSTVPDWNPRSGPVAMFGAGGAARAIIVALLDHGVQELRLSNRTVSRANALAHEFGSRVIVTDWTRAGDIVDGAATVVNTTSLGMQGKSPFTVPLSKMRNGTVACDIVYTPLETPFLTAARACGARVVDGLGMLLYQAQPGFERWFGKRPDVTQALRDEMLAG